MTNYESDIMPIMKDPLPYSILDIGNCWGKN